MEWLPLDFFISDVYTELCVHCTHLYPLGFGKGESGGWTGEGWKLSYNAVMYRNL